MLIKLKKVLKGFDNQDIKMPDGTLITAGVALSNIILGNQDKIMDKMKLYILAQKVYNSDEIDIDEADFANVKKMVESDAGYPTIVSGQLLAYLEGIK